MKKIAPTSQDAKTRLLDLRAQNAANRQTRAEWEHLPLTLTDAKAQLSSWLDHKPRDAHARLAGVSQYLQHPGAHGVALFETEHDLPQLLESLLCFLFRDRLEPILLAELERIIPADRPGRARVEEERRRLDAEWRTLEREEERLIRRMEAEGAAVDRRGDADPATVLADDDALAET